jgi:hypothetical protein
VWGLHPSGGVANSPRGVAAELGGDFTIWWLVNSPRGVAAELGGDFTIWWLVNSPRD